MPYANKLHKDINEKGVEWQTTAWARVGEKGFRWSK